MESNWSKYFSFTDVNWEAIPDRPGVYQIRCVDRSGKPTKIRRLAGMDKKGIVSIGESVRLEERLKQFWKSTRKDMRHAAAWHYFAFCYDKKFPKKSLQFCYKVAASKGDKGKREAMRSEFISLLEYRKKFMDGPPLNVPNSTSKCNEGRSDFDWFSEAQAFSGPVVD